MSRELVVEDTGFGVRGAVLDDGRLIDLIDVDRGGSDVTDRLFRVRVDHIDTRLNAAFLDYGGAERGFLAAKDARYVAGVVERRPINKLVQEGQWLIVQGVREADESKGPRFTTDVKLFGIFLVLRPFGMAIEASVKIRGHRREQVLERAAILFGEDRGVLLRQQAIDVDDESLNVEFAELDAQWGRTRKAFEGGKKAGRIEVDEAPLTKLLRQVSVSDLRAISAGGPALIGEARAFLERLPSASRPELLRLDAASGAFAQTGVDHLIAHDLEREIALDRGGRIIIEETAACTAIDVDGGNRDAQDIDLDAAREIARLVRLRQLGGTIVIDFVDLPTKPQRQQLENALKRAFKGDPAPVQIYPMSPLGLIQLSRARRGAHWSARWYRPCGSCDGKGRAPSLRRQAEGALASIRQASASTPTLRLASDLYDFMQREAPSTFKSIATIRDQSLAAGEFALEGAS
ncbi:MAG: ribonuclease E/G [Pseudomonadota bacterium]